MLLKLGLIAIALLVGSVVVFQTAGQVFQDPDERPGIRLNEEVTRTNRTAGRLDNSFANVLPPMPVRRNVSFALPGGQASSVAPRSSVLGDSDGVGRDILVGGSDYPVRNGIGSAHGALTSGPVSG